MSYLFFADVAGGSGNPPVQGTGGITCLAPKGGDPQAVQLKTYEHTVSSPSGVYRKYDNRFNYPTYYSA